jgi:putative efflux protein, MATE family
VFGKGGKNKYEYMTETPVPKLIIQLAIPTTISMLVTGLYNSADTYFVGQIPVNATGATAAVGIVFPVMAIIQAVGFLFGHGSGNYLSRMLGAGKNREASEMASTGFAMAMITGIIIAVLGNVFINDIIQFFATGDVSSETYAMTAEYGRIILIGAPFMMCQFVINNQLRYQGSAVYAMIGLIAGAIINIFLDPLLILMLGMGVRGAAIATIGGQITSFFILLIGSRRGENIKIHLKDIHINGHFIKEVINGGAPSLFRQGLAALASILMNRAAGTYGGEAAIAGMSIVTRVMLMLSAALIGFGQGYQPVCSFNYGAGLKARVREGFWFCVRWGTVLLIVIATLCYFYAPQIIAFFRDDADVVAVGKVALRFQSVVFPLNAVIVMTNMMLQSIGKGIKASITASARNGIFFIPLILLLPTWFGLRGVEVTQSVADVLTLIISIPFAASELLKMREE